MEPGSQEGVMKSRANHACQSCRALKARCLPSDTSGTCRKCEKSGKQCIFNDKPVRQRKQYSSRTSKIETKLDILMNQLNERSNSKRDFQESPEKVQSSESTSDVRTTKSAFIESTPGEIPSFDVGIEDSSNSAAPQFDFDDFFDILGDDDQEFNALLERSLLSKERAGYLLDRFRNMTQHFPFVVIPPSASIDSMAYERPFLLLTAITAACAEDQQLQQALGQEVRGVLSQRVVFDGEKNLDILEGLLVHLTWYQYHHVPGRQQFQQFLQIALSLMTDLGLDKTPSEAYIERMGLNISHYYEDTSMSSTKDFYSREARRCYLGCYYLCNAIHFGYWRPTQLKHTEYMTKCAESLRDEAEYPTDALMPCLIRFGHLSEQLNTIYKLSLSESPTQTVTSIALMQMHAQTFATQLEAWKTCVPQIPNFEGDYGTNYTQLSTRIHEMGYVSRQKTFSPSFPVSSPDVLQTLFTCINAAKSHFTAFFTIPLSHYSSLPLLEWKGLITAVFMLYRFSTRTVVPGWNYKSAREIIRLDQLLSELSYRLQGVAPSCNFGFDGSTAQEGTLYNQFHLMVDDVRASYLRIKDQGFEDFTETSPHNIIKTPVVPGKRTFRSKLCPFFKTTAPMQEQDLPKDDHAGNESAAAFDTMMQNWTTGASANSLSYPS